MFAFTIPAGHKAGACAEDCPRYAMGSALAYRGCQNGKAYLASCNGKALAILPLDAEGPAKPILLPAKAVCANGRDRKVEVNGEVRFTDGKKTEVSPLPEQEGRWPNLTMVLPGDVVNAYTMLNIDAKQLAELASAVSPDGKLCVLIPKPGTGNQVDKPIVVIGRSESGFSGIGLLMPHYFQKEPAAPAAYYRSVVQEVPNQSIAFPQKEVEQPAHST